MRSPRICSLMNLQHQPAILVQTSHHSKILRLCLSQHRQRRNRCQRRNSQPWLRHHLWHPHLNQMSLRHKKMSFHPCQKALSMTSLSQKRQRALQGSSNVTCRIALAYRRCSHIASFATSITACLTVSVDSQERYSRLHACNVATLITACLTVSVESHHVHGMWSLPTVHVTKRTTI